MRKSLILKAIETELKKSNLQNNSIVEIFLEAQNSTRNKNRLAYCILTKKDHSLEKVKTILEKSTKINSHFNLIFNDYLSIQSAMAGNAEGIDDPVIIENNWRGRLFRFEHLESHLSDLNKIDDFMLRSTWRIIVQRDTENNYYVRHDIYPFFWSPGHSTAGKNNFEEDIKNEFWSVTEPKFHRQDDDFDVVKVFAKDDHKGGAFFQPLFSPVDSTPTEETSEVRFDISHEIKKSYLDNVINHLKNYFGN